MGAQITIIGGGSYQWTPKLLVDFVNTPALREAEIVLHDIDPAPLPHMVELAGHLATVRVLNLTNPMTTICRALTRETPLKAVGLCHEITVTQFLLSLLLDVSFLDLTLTVGGVNHLPFITALDVAGDDGFELLRAVLDDAETRGSEPLPMAIPDGLEFEKHSGGPEWTKGDVLRNWRVKLELFDRFGVLPGAGDRHLAEFFPSFLTADSGWGSRWGIELTTIEDRERDQDAHVAALGAMLASTEVESMPSGEMVAPVIQCLLLDQAGRFPLNVPNDGQVPDLPLGATVECMCVVSGNGIGGHDVVALPAGIAECLRRVSASQELTVEAAVTGDRDAAFAAMLLDPLTSRLDYDAIATMTDEMLDATSVWLPQFPPP